MRRRPFEVVEAVTRRPHRCTLPSWNQRRKLDLGYGSRVRCTECSQLWEWGYDWTEVCWKQMDE